MVEDTSKDAEPTETCHLQLVGPTMCHENDEGEGPLKEPPEKGSHGGSPILWTQILGASAVAMTSFASGCGYVYSGVTLPELMNTNSTDIVLDESNAALFSGFLSIGYIFGSLCGGMLMVRLGQRVSILISLPFALLSWVSIALGSSVPLLHVTRILQGFTLGICAIAGPNYVVEFASVNYRGRLGGFVDLARSVGMLFVYCVGAVLSWRHLALVCGTATVVPPFLTLLFLPDSPRWLASKRRFQKAEKSLHFFRGQTFDINPEMSDIMKSADHMKKKTTVVMQMKQLHDCVLLKHFLILMFMMLGFPFAGYMTILSYTVAIFEDTGTGINAYTAAILVGVARVIGAVFHFLIVDKLGRRVVFLCTTLLCGITMVGLCTYFYIKIEMANEDLLLQIRALPLISMTVFVFSISSSLQTLLLLQRELLPLGFRAMGGGILSLASGLSIFLNIQLFPILNASLGFHGSFATNAFFAMVLAFVPLIILPETKGRSLEEIEESMRENVASVDQRKRKRQV